MIVFITSFFTCFFYFIIGKQFFNSENNFSNNCISIINGAIILSFLALLLNFFLPLNLIVNTCVAIFFIFSIFFSINFKKVFNLTTLKNITFISFICSILIFLAESNRPDSGLYHFPFIKLLNDEKIIFGITNINSRFGTVSIIQYLQAISNNYITKNNGMLLPLSIIPSTILAYFYIEIINQLKNLQKINKFYVFFIFCSLIFFTYKMNRYGAYGNDYIGHFLIFFLFFLILKKSDNIKIHETYFYSVFILLNKITFVNILIFPAILIFKKFKWMDIINHKNFLISVFLLLWLIKNVINSSCLIWPIEKTCIKYSTWFNHDITSTQHVSKLEIINKAWSKGYPDQLGEKLGFEEFLENYKWLETWIKNHGKKISKILFIYIVIIIIISFYLRISSKSVLKKNFYENWKNKLLIYLSVFLLGVLIWFFNFPVFRFGISNLVISIIILFMLIIKDFDINEKNKNFIKYFSSICMVIFYQKI